jgi:Zn-dependent protease with chaperone function
MAGAWLCAGCAVPDSRLPELSKSDVEAEQRLEQVAQMRDYYVQRARVDNVAFHIRVANRRFCKLVAPQLGLYAGTVESLPKKYRSYSHEALAISWTKPTVISVADGSPAATAGLKVGDQILSLDNDVVPATHTDGWIGDWLTKHHGEPVRVSFNRDGKLDDRMVYPVAACAIPINYVSNPTPNAFTDAKKIVIQSGILRVAQTDAQLAVVIGHELAHVNLGHYGKRTQNMLLGAMGGAMVDGGFMLGGLYTGRTFTRRMAAVGAHAFSVSFEREADYVGTYYAARAGYDISGAEQIWRNLSLESPNSIRLKSDHPLTPARFVQMQKTIAEIEDKKRRGLALVPDLKEVAAQPAAAPMNY